MRVVIEAGELNQRIRIDIDNGVNLDAAGQRIENWVTWTGVTNGLLWASLRALSGREVERAATMQVYATHLLTTRWVPGLTPVKMRAVLGSRAFDFGFVNNVDEANVQAEIMCSERLA